MFFIKFITVVICSMFMFYFIWMVNKGFVNSVHFLYLGFYFFMVFPLVLDLLVGRPDYYSAYYKFIGFEISHADPTTEVFYCMLLIFSSLFLFVFGKRGNLPIDEVLYIPKSGMLQKLIVVFFSIIVFLPTIFSIVRIKETNCALTSILDYRFLSTLFRGEPHFLGYYYLSLFVVLSFIVILWISNKSVLTLTLLFSLPLYVAIGIHGKRNIIAILLFLYVFVIFFKARIKTRIFKYLLLAFVIVLLFMSIKYQADVRNINASESFSRFYTDFRVDYGRDDVIKMAIYYEINSNGILKDHLNTHLYFLKYVSPIFDSIRSEYKYSVYATSTLLGYNRPVDLGWGMTTGIFDESIANYGVVLGMIIANVILVIICRLGDGTRNGLALVLTYITSLLFMILQLTAFIFVFAIWTLVMLYAYCKKTK